MRVAPGHQERNLQMRMVEFLPLIFQEARHGTIFQWPSTPVIVIVFLQEALISLYLPMVPAPGRRSVIGMEVLVNNMFTPISIVRCSDRAVLQKLILPMMVASIEQQMRMPPIQRSRIKEVIM